MDGGGSREHDEERWSADEESLETFGSGDPSSHHDDDNDDNHDSYSSSGASSRISDGTGSSTGSSYYSSDDYDDDSSADSASSSSYDSRDNRDNQRRGTGGLHVDFGMGAFRDTLVGVVRHRRSSRTPADSRQNSNHAGDIRAGTDQDNYNYSYNERYEDDRDDDDSYRNNRKRRRQQYDPPTSAWGKMRRMMSLFGQILEHHCPSICGSRKATAILVASVLLWLLVHIGTNRHPQHAGMDSYSGDPASLSDPLLSREHRGDRRKEAEHALGSAAGEYIKKNNRRPKKSGGNRDKLPPGCSYPKESWVHRAMPNCNEIHEIDLRRGYNPRRRNVDATALAAVAEGGRATGYVGSGLWRDVWKVDPRAEAASDDGENSHQDNDIVPPAVLKVMKQEHPYDFRNYDRHRRDALVMERLSSSEYVVDIYGYCANSVLSEYVGRTLDDLIYEDNRRKDDEEDGDDLDSIGFIESVPELTRDTPVGRIRLALDVFKGISHLHDIPGGPIIHADLQAKQFLIDPSTQTVRINDFNRCRFVPRKDGDPSGEMCPVKIPSAPGVNRSPEEYGQLRLTEKIDVFSAGNILYGILTGHRHWATSSKRVIKKAVMSGQKPAIPDKFLQEPSDKALAELMDRAYEKKSKRRISAREMVEELEVILNAAKEDEGRDSLRKK